MPKVYFHDLGIRNKLLNRFYNFNEREDKGYLIENYLLIRLNELYSNDQIKYWRTAAKNEVDFIITESYNNGKAYEVKHNDREFREKNYKKFNETYQAFPLRCISYHTSNIGIPILKI